MSNKVYEVVQPICKVLHNKYLKICKKRKDESAQIKCDSILIYAKSIIKDDLLKFKQFYVKNRNEFNTEKEVYEYIKV